MKTHEKLLIPVFVKFRKIQHPNYTIIISSRDADIRVEIISKINPEINAKSTHVLEDLIELSEDTIKELILSIITMLIAECVMKELKKLNFALAEKN
jgi:type III secretory pathway component EscU